MKEKEEGSRRKKERGGRREEGEREGTTSKFLGLLCCPGNLLSTHKQNLRTVACLCTAHRGQTLAKLGGVGPALQTDMSR